MDLAQSPRVGSPYFIGHGFPPDLDISVQGVGQRIGYVWFLDTLQAIDRDTADLWASPDEAARLRAWLILWAHEAWATRNDKPWITPEREEALRQLSGQAIEGNPDAQAILLLHDHYESASGSWITNTALQKTLTEAGIPCPEKKAWGKLIRRAYPKADNRQMGKERGWIGIRPRGDYEGVPESDTSQALL